MHCLGDIVCEYNSRVIAASLWHLCKNSEKIGTFVTKVGFIEHVGL